MNTKELLENISTNCLDQLTKYKYNKNLNISDKYRKGKITALTYTLDLIYHFYEKDRLLKKEFEHLLSEQIKDSSKLKNGDYKKGIDEILNWTKAQLNDTKH